MAKHTTLLIGLVVVLCCMYLSIYYVITARKKERKYMISIDGCEIIDLPKIEDARGNLSIIEELTHIPFKINRTYWIYDVPGGQIRGGHAFKIQKEFIVALSGSFDVIVDNGKQRAVYSLNRSYYGLYVHNCIWRQMQNFSTNSLALVLSSTNYEESDYIRDYEKFLESVC